mmetsp:Transcript_20020/g.24290  ORF Transcript_20020/g.24290 Transcript_20020/m.24290 type:complete len:193 (-) Transcript_20020:30-608(-)
MTDTLRIPGQEQEPEEEELTSEKLWEQLRLTEYKISRVFNKEFFNAEDLGATKPGLKRDVNEAIKQARQIITDDADQKKAVEYASKLLALLAVHDYLRDDKKKSLKEFFDQVSVCGWEILKGEAWAAELVQKASGSSHYQAVKAIEDTPSGDLSEAIHKAPGRSTVVPPVGVGKPPTQEAIATMKRLKKKKK